MPRCFSNNLIIKLTQLSILLSIAGCVTNLNSNYLGLKSDYIAFAPADISVLSSMVWRENFFFPKNLKFNPSKEDLNIFQEKLDDFVLESFDNQPYISGYSPKVVDQLLKKAKKTDLQKKVLTFLTHNENLDKCTDPVQCYEKNLAPQKEWRLWLQDLSSGVDFSDSLLLPFIYFMEEKQIDDRGLLVSLRRASVILLLIDTRNGKLIWSGQTIAEKANRVLQTIDTNYPAFLDWKYVLKDLLVEKLWVDFPNRLTKY